MGIPSDLEMSLKGEDVVRDVLSLDRLRLAHFANADLLIPPHYRTRNSEMIEFLTHRSGALWDSLTSSTRRLRSVWEHDALSEEDPFRFQTYHRG
ncbi:hypothetical protein PC116_g20214 [Phytophthora cactorum]|nr:hypothetical protein PC116_g20214 [Phytophthora cactorum]